MNYKRAAALLMAATLTVGLSTACGKGADSSDAAATTTTAPTTTTTAVATVYHVTATSKRSARCFRATRWR